VFFYIGLYSAVAVNWVIDKFGHTVVNGHPRRAFATHSVFTAPVVGAVVTVVPVMLFVSSAGASVSGYIPNVPLFILALAAIGVVAAYTHLFLDAFTEGGIYVVRRHALAHCAYNNVIVNGAAIVAGLGLVVAGTPALTALGVL
jgi:hypothetical protein